ncbi:MAG: hypothetical protein ACXVCY_18570 [Pseudobdellovibrionaceae bacterium]
MGIGERLKGMASSAQDSARTSAISMFHFSLRFTTGVLLGLVFGLIGQELAGYGSLALLFVMVVVLATIMRLLANWSISQVLIFDLICILVMMLMRMYILVAP